MSGTKHAIFLAAYHASLLMPRWSDTAAEHALQSFSVLLLTGCSSADRRTWKTEQGRKGKRLLSRA